MNLKRIISMWMLILSGALFVFSSTIDKILLLPAFVFFVVGHKIIYDNWKVKNVR